MKEMYLECPSHILKEIDEVIDGHFVIATELESNPEYRDYFLYGHHTKPLILDNGTYETGTPMDWKQLSSWATMLSVKCVFAPDYFREGRKTFEAWMEVKDFEGANVGFIPQGDTPEGIVYWICMALREVKSSPRPLHIGLSFLNDRDKVIKLIEQKGFHLHNVRWHALGLCSWKEHWELPSWISSYDTVKPIKAAYYGMKVENLPRGIGKWSSKMKIQRMDLVFRNIAIMRRNPDD